MVPLNCLSNFGRILEIPLINCGINIMLTWSAIFVISSNASTDQETIFTITNTKLYSPIINLSTQDKAIDKTITAIEIIIQTHNHLE